jgi:hypothetical protein
MTDMPKRHFWQLHLSTAILAMFASGAMLYVNTQMKVSYQMYYVWPYMGWPFAYWSGDARMTGSARLTMEYTGSDIFPNPSPFSYLGLSLDIIIGIIVVGAFTIICEWLIRRRETRKP